MRHRKVLALTPAEYEQNKPPADSSGVFGGEMFTEGVSRVMPYAKAARFAAEGYVALPPDEADEYVERVRGSDAEDSADEKSQTEEESPSEDEKSPEDEEVSEDGDSEDEPPVEENEEEPGPSKPDISKEDIKIGETSSEEDEDEPDTLPDAERLRSLKAPDGYEDREDVPSYHDQLTELADAGVSPQALFGGQPKKEDLLALHCAWKEGVDALVPRGD